MTIFEDKPQQQLVRASSKMKGNTSSVEQSAENVQPLIMRLSMKEQTKKMGIYKDEQTNFRGH